MCKEDETNWEVAWVDTDGIGVDGGETGKDWEVGSEKVEWTG